MSTPASSPSPAPSSAPADQKSSKAVKGKKDKAADETEDVDSTPVNTPWVMPAFIENRLKMWDEIAVRQTAELQSKAAANESIAITLPDGKVINGIAGVTTPMEIAKGISNSLADRIIVAKVNDSLWDLLRPLESSCSLQLLDFDSPEGSHVFWHSSAHVLGQALEKEFKDARLCIGPPLEEGGFYYDVFLGEEKVHPDQYKSLERTISTVTKQKQPFQRLVLKKEEALAMFAENPFKLEIINSKVPDGGVCTAYRCGPLVDLCKGPHVPSTGTIKAMSVTKSSSAYWMAKSDNASLQRVYGISFPNKQKLKEYKELLKQAEERDHRKVGLQQELFFFHKWSPGSAFFLPHGTRIYNRLMQFIRTQYTRRGYSEVITPNVYNIDLWRTSGHWQNYAENMFSFTCENQDFAIKPMNCPGHCLLFDERLRSYRELPLRYADFGVLHRNEISGALTGLTRVRRFQQDDAHIFCMNHQIEEEVAGVLDFLSYAYGIFGFEFTLMLSTRPEKYLGEVEVWNKAEAALTACLDKFVANSPAGAPKTWTINPGDGAFYGPKIDIQLTDALKRKHQCATIQLDFQLPIRFDLKYKSSGEGDQEAFERPVMIHRAILGSVERMIAVLTEHTGGKWPFWLSPRQAIVIPVGNTYNAYANQVKQLVHNAGYYCDVDDSHKQLNKKIREAQLAQYNYILVVGEKEETDHSVTVRLRDEPTAQYVRTNEQLLQEFANLSNLDLIYEQARQAKQAAADSEKQAARK